MAETTIAVQRIHTVAFLECCSSLNIRQRRLAARLLRPVQVIRFRWIWPDCRLSATMGHWNGQKNPRELRLGELPG